MKKILMIILVLHYCYVVLSQTINTSDSIKSYVDFLKGGTFLSSKEYVLKSFEKKDIVILSERHHQELTQYELIVDIIKDERFKGNVYTEAGVYNAKDKINEFLAKEGLSKDEKENELLKIYRNIDYDIIWDKYNYYYLLNSIYEINQNRKNDDKIFLIPLDIDFSWDSVKCPSQYNMFMTMMETQVIDRNKIMGDHFVRAYSNSKYNNPNKAKALVILNTYHGYTKIPVFLPFPTMPRTLSSAEYIYKTFPNATKGILINGYSFSTISKFVAGGKWDAAFKIFGKKDFAFDMKDTPFGKTIFDMYRFGGSFDTVNFEFIFDGFVYYMPIDDWKLAVGIPNIVSTEFNEEFYRRCSMSDDISIDDVKKSTEVKEYIEQINNLNISKPSVLDELNTEIGKWIK